MFVPALTAVCCAVSCDVLRVSAGIAAVSERLRREGARRHEDTRFEVEEGRPLADLRHVLGECSGLPDRAQRVEGLVEALSKMGEAVPDRADTADFLKLTRDARAALNASDQGTLTEEQWGQVDRVLAACVPDFAREESTPAERRELIQDVVAALQTVHGRAVSAVQAWHTATRSSGGGTRSGVASSCDW